MLACAKHVVETYNGVFPTSLEELITLPGVGPYTAQAIMSFAQDQNILSLDTNLQKIFARYYYGSRKHKLSKDDIQDLQNQFLTTDISGRDMNNALMDFANLVSINNPTKIDWDYYPLHDCAFFRDK